MDSVLELINRRQRQILVHSFLYYQLNENIIDDYTFDKWANELASLMKQHENQFKESAYCEVYKDFDGSSGFSLPFSNPEIQSVGYRLLRFYRERLSK